MGKASQWEKPEVKGSRVRSHQGSKGKRVVRTWMGNRILVGAKIFKIVTFEYAWAGRAKSTSRPRAELSSDRCFRRPFLVPNIRSIERWDNGLLGIGAAGDPMFVGLDCACGRAEPGFLLGHASCPGKNRRCAGEKTL
jgi:hypothetical protein